MKLNLFFKPIFKNVKFELPKSYTQTPINLHGFIHFLLYNSILNIPVIRGVPRSIDEIVFELSFLLFI